MSPPLSREVALVSQPPRLSRQKSAAVVDLVMLYETR